MTQDWHDLSPEQQSLRAQYGDGQLWNEWVEARTQKQKYKPPPCTLMRTIVTTLCVDGKLNRTTSSGKVIATKKQDSDWQLATGAWETQPYNKLWQGHWNICQNRRS